jgi:hypothetical protein
MNETRRNARRDCAQYRRWQQFMQLSNIERKYDSVVFRLPELQAQCSDDKFVV